MSAVTDIWRQLVRRRLWPVALALVAALAAVPVLLAEDPEPAPAPKPIPAGQAAVPAADGEPIVAMASAEEARRRRVLGARKDPFEPAPIKLPKATPTAAPVGDAPVAGAPEKPSGSFGGSTVGSRPSAPSSPAPAAPPAPAQPEAVKKPSYPLHTLTVRFGATEASNLPKDKVRRLEALPSADEPVLVYLGVEEGGKVAVFMVDTGVEAQGDGVCKPDPAVCETLHLREGETEFFDVLDEDGDPVAQYQLDLLDIKRRTTTSASKARAASKAGRSVLRARQADVGPLRYRYDVKSGSVRKLGKRAYRALLAKTARAALGTAGGF
jgi:hypothetical protein